MIVDKLENSSLYAGISERLAKAFEILKDKSVLEKEDGRYEVDGENLFYIVQHYQSRPIEQGRLEAHKKYIDVQYIVSGEEIINHTLVDGSLEVDEPYDEAKERIFYKPPEQMSPIIFRAGMFGVFFLHDAHMACLEVDGPSQVHKVVVKVRV